MGKRRMLVPGLLFDGLREVRGVSPAVWSSFRTNAAHTSRMPKGGRCSQWLTAEAERPRSWPCRTCWPSRPTAWSAGPGTAFGGLTLSPEVGTDESTSGGLTTSRKTGYRVTSGSFTIAETPTTIPCCWAGTASASWCAGARKAPRPGGRRPRSRPSPPSPAQ